ncbi:MAG: lysophospholipid acyltransferase family protein [Polyangiales bacterium]|nr:1-acyl-sn-glycerol-3-phosphate acyltransferase [Myxococcales bacterium]MCB9660223.1 1-acyl-sn-glycerol-3-phosphate acyltransferase [Sandaracinaceae bacterium]
MSESVGDALATPSGETSLGPVRREPGPQDLVERDDGPRTDSRLSQGLRTLATFASFAMFFTGSVLLGLLFVPLFLPFALFNLKRYRALCTRFVGRGLGTFLYWMKVVRLITYEMPVPPEGLEGRPYVVVANHPTLIDVPFLLHSFPRLTSIVKWNWYNFGPFALVLRSLNYIPADGAPTKGAAEDSDTPALDRMVAHVEAGHPLVCFPEGSRSLRTGLRRFRRGPFETAVRAKVPIVSVFIDVNRPMLDRSHHFWQVPEGTTHFRFEVREVIETDPTRGGERDAEAIRKRVRDDLAACYAGCLERRAALRALETKGIATNAT